ncbi:MAG: adenylate cyclase, class 2 [Methanothermococcus sp.]|uniref:class IV adenylate cyclase n=1 Tax=Methanothermococcus TaxID=155862 RepID=UPI00038009BB|nr:MULTISPECIES: class IV adenylate cyclase [Methanothermococcus]MDK2789512.1 adenylate cyclase, class 2 [Methanothermococcus sp.]MDK2987445.1 adenylate cyclase, class 2 [Methanothermococcus sp.]
MIEVEVKARLNEDEINELISKLLDMGFKRIEKKEEVDVYFNGIDRDFSVTDEALRVRKSLKMDTGQVKFYVTYKGPKLDNVSKTREEIEVTVDNGAAIHKIFEKLGFKPVKPIKKLREIYSKDDIEVSIDCVDDVGSYVEFEKTVMDVSKKEDALQSLLDLMKSLNISNDKLERKSYLELRRGN